MGMQQQATREGCPRWAPVWERPAVEQLDGTSGRGSGKGRSSSDGGSKGVGAAGALERKGNTSSSK